jgi:hypothetical protein
LQTLSDAADSLRLPELASYPTGPAAERSVERCGLGVLQEERDVADAQPAILQEGAGAVVATRLHDRQRLHRV